MKEIYIIDVVCMLIGKFIGILFFIWIDDLVVYVLKVFMDCYFDIFGEVYVDVIMGCVN